MQVAIPHDIGKDAVRHRLRTRSHEIADHIPGGMAEVHTEWPHPDRMAMAITAMGQALHGHVDIEENRVVFEMTLPPALGFLQPMIEGAIRQQGQSLLAPPEGDSR